MQRDLISHNATETNLLEFTQKAKDRIIDAGNKDYVTVERQLDLLDQLTAFDFGKFLLQNQGVDGYWTHYMLTHPWFGRKTRKNNAGQAFSELEEFVLDRSPLMLATQERFTIFLQQIQKHVVNNASLACIPSGMLGELLYLDFSNIENIKLTGFDYDSNALNDAASLAENKNLSPFVELIESNAWELSCKNEFDLISSNGLNIYEPNPENVTQLYQRFYDALKPQGTLVTSFINAPPGFTDNCEWDMDKINQNDLLLQRILFADIIQAKFQCFSSSSQTEAQLKSVGFKNIEIVNDAARIFPTVIASK